MNHRFPLALSKTVATAAAALLLLAPFAHAAEPAPASQDPLPTRPGAFSLKLEPGVSFPLGAPQSTLFSTGGSFTIKGLWALNRYLLLGPSVTYLALPASGPAAEAGTEWAFGPSLVLTRPRDLPDNDSLFNIAPWIDVDAQYVRTGPLNRFGFAVGVGAAVPIGKARNFWLGPFVRYSQIFQGTRDGYDNRDAMILTAGLSLEVGGGVDRPKQQAAPAEVVPVAPVPVSCPDRDGDGVPDNVDRCPDVAGSWENHGCPPYQTLVVQPDRLELKEKLYFKWNQAVIEEASFPTLNEVAQALKDNKNFKVQVEGHASSEGTYDHNQDLSERRAEAVVDYLVARGVPRDRLVSKGFSSSVPAATNDTQTGREQNRRVEFVVNFKIINDGSK
jgi:outer membrane protein OmpA-like peptidoglycan-associated protein